MMSWSHLWIWSHEGGLSTTSWLQQTCLCWTRRVRPSSLCWSQMMKSYSCLLRVACTGPLSEMYLEKLWARTFSGLSVSKMKTRICLAGSDIRMEMSRKHVVLTVHQKRGGTLKTLGINETRVPTIEYLDLPQVEGGSRSLRDWTLESQV